MAKAYRITAALAALGWGLAASAAFAQPAPSPAPAASAGKPPAAPGGPRGGLTPEREANLDHRHDGFYGALAPQNLHKPRPKAPADFTGVWFINLRHAFSDTMQDSDLNLGRHMIVLSGLLEP